MVDEASDYGEMVEYYTRLIIAIGQDDPRGMQRSLRQMRRRASVSPRLLQLALVYMEEYEEARDIFAARLADPSQRSGVLLGIQGYSSSSEHPTRLSRHLSELTLGFYASPEVRSILAEFGRIEYFNVKPSPLYR